MTDQTASGPLRHAIESLAEPYDSVDDVLMSDLLLDAITSELLNTDFAAQRLGTDRAAKLRQRGVNAPHLLQSLGRDFSRAAQVAKDLLDIQTSSILDVNSYNTDVAQARSEIDSANVLRRELYESLSALLENAG